uniref:Endo/exonuclease/phosphatase domain-containing protein n=1 Tax=Anopheles albimanus TaxID=7167 RepID=A0A182FPZ5_ANOAL
MNHLPEDIKFAQWNANGISHHKYELIDFLSSEKVDICAISETFLKPEMKFTIPGYRVYRLDRTSGAKGGVAIIVKRNINIQLLNCISLKTIEAIGVTAQTSTGPLTFISVYHPGGNNSQPCFSHDILKLVKIKHKFIICGDLNARHKAWNCESNNWAGKVLFDLMIRDTFSVCHPETPTHFPSDHNRRPSTIDIIVTNIPHILSTPIAPTQLSSDHLPVITVIQNMNHQTVPQNKIFDYSRANWPLFRKTVSNQINLNSLHHSSLKNPVQIDELINSLTETIKEAQELSVPKIIPGHYNIKMPDIIKSLIRIKNSYRRKWQRNRSDQFSKFMMNALIELIQKKLATVRNDSWNKTLEAISQDGKSSNKLWKLVKTIKKPPSSIPPLQAGNQLLLSPHEKCAALKTQFESAHNLTFDSLSRHERMLNKEKTEAIFFTRNTSTLRLPSKCANIGDTEIPWNKSIKYLGITLDPRLTFQKHIEDRLQKSEKMLRSLYGFINRKAKLNTRNKILIYTSIIRPVLTYASPVWTDCAATHKNYPKPASVA